MKAIGKGILSIVLIGIINILIAGCKPEKAQEVRRVPIAENEIDPEVWGKNYPVEYELWLKTKEPRPEGKSKYKKGFDGGKIVDKLSEYPFMALLYKGWGFGIEYNEPRGHYYMVIDQLEIDPSRLKAGGVCLSCKSPYAPYLEKQLGKDYYMQPYKDVWSKIPEKHRQLGAACIDCHNPKDMGLKIARDFTLGKALQDIGVKNPSHQLMRSLVCAQCHVTYVIPKDENMKSVGLFFPWQGSKLGEITIENIIKVLKSNPSYKEWKQEVTGFKLAYIRHPEFEFYAHKSSPHWRAGVACADCHMPYVRVGAHKVSDHNITSPLKNDLKACRQCHAQDPEELRKLVYEIQDRTITLLLRAGYATARVAKIFEIANKAKENGKNINEKLYSQAKDLYEEAFYRVVFVGAENSVGFHNPTEAQRILGDAMSFAKKAELLLRDALSKAGVNIPTDIDLELPKYLNNRGEKKLNFKPELEIKDPFGTLEVVGKGF